MRIKKFSSRTVTEALAAVRAEFGEDAVILSTARSEADPRAFDVVAAIDVPVREPRSPLFPRVDRDGRSLDEAPARVSVSSTEPMLPPAFEPAAAAAGPSGRRPSPRGVAPSRPLEEASDAEMPILMLEDVADEPEPVEDAPEPESMDRARLLDEIEGLRGRLETVAGLLLSATPDDLPEESRRMHLRLVETGLDPRLAAAVLRRAEKIDVPLERAVHHILSAAVRCGGPVERGLGQQVIAFVGPTGVGKTTTIAKIAAQLVLTEKRRVALVSADGFRVAGAQQLEFYADILDAPFHAAHDRGTLEAAIAASHEAEVVLVDTTGRGGADTDGVDEIAATLEGDARLQRWLVLSAVASTMDNLAALRTFARLRPGGIIVTKLDESAAHGAAATILVRSGLPLRYLADGQSVPDDLIAATRDVFPDLLLTGRAR